MCNWHNAGELKPCNRALEEAIGKPIPPGVAIERPGATIKPGWSHA